MVHLVVVRWSSAYCGPSRTMNELKLLSQGIFYGDYSVILDKRL